jgi:predicted PurR-regulated permease PerM
VLLGLAATVVVVAGMRAAGDLLGTVLLALVLTVTVHPLHQWLNDHLPWRLGTVVCLLAVYLLIAALAVALLAATARFASLLPTYEEQFNDLVDDALGWLSDAGVSADDVATAASSLQLGQLGGFVTDLLAGLAGLVGDLVFIVSLIFFMVIDDGQFPRSLAAAARARPRLVQSLVTFAHGTRTYLWVATVFGLVVAAIDTVALALLDIPVPLVWGLLAFLTGYIPNIGFVIGLVPPAVLALLEEGPGLMVAVVVVYCVVNMLIQSALQPKVVGDAVGLSSTLSFLSLVVWTWVIGPLGAVLAIPLSLLVRAVFVDADPANRWLVPLVANQDPDAAAPPRPARSSRRAR